LSSEQFLIDLNNFIKETEDKAILSEEFLIDFNGFMVLTGSIMNSDNYLKIYHLFQKFYKRVNKVKIKVV
jgi:hypothetical protein